MDSSSADAALAHSSSFILLSGGRSWASVLDSGVISPALRPVARRVKPSPVIFVTIAEQAITR
ncbi:MAG: hypothetical protein ACKV2U_01315 [Bryobacteraceae bacterium]